MIAVLLLGLALGLDSFRVSVGLGLARPSRRRRLVLASTFGLCDGLSPLVGFAAGRAIVEWISPWSDWLGALALALSGGYMILVASLPEGGEEDPRWVIGLPVVLSLDNMVAGIGLGALGFPMVWSAAVLGLVSGTLAWVGLTLGVAAARPLPFRAGLVAGFTMIAVGVVEGWRAAVWGR